MGLFDGQNKLVLDDRTFTSFQKMVYDYSGMFFDVSQKFFLEKRLNNRVNSLQFNSFKDYYLFLLYDPKRLDEMALLVDLLTTNETYFFREIFQLKAFYEEIIPQLISKKDEGTLNIWSAGCSTGEEPYTIAIIAAELASEGLLKNWKVDILGSDISHRVLGTARKGVYTDISFREMDDKYFKYFDDLGDGKRKIKNEIHEQVSFNYLNLFDDTKIALLKKMDIIFCRNVLIYFDTLSKQKVVDSFYDKLSPGGYFLLGHSESLMNISTVFNLKHLKNDLVYQKPDIFNESGILEDKV